MTMGKLLILAIIFFGVYDLYIEMIKEKTEETLTHVVYDASKEWPIIPLVVGIVIGHIFWTK